MQLPDDCVEYMLFVIDDTIKPHELVPSLEAVRDAAIQLCDNLTADYIWQRQSFNLDIRTEGGKYIFPADQKKPKNRPQEEICALIR